MQKFSQSNNYISYYDYTNKIQIIIYRYDNLIEIKYNNVIFNINKSIIKIHNNKTTIDSNFDIKLKNKIVNVFNLLIAEINKLNNKETIFFNEKIKLDELILFY
jgi:hypothetical protein